MAVGGAISYDSGHSITGVGGAQSAYTAVRPAIWIEVGSSEETVSSTSANSTIYDGTHELVALKEAEVGDFVLFGKYEQDNDLDNGKENIEWLVLDKQDGKILVISKYAIDTHPFHAFFNGSNWAKSNLRNWLNNTFLSESFSRKETMRILETSVDLDRNPQMSTVRGKTTKDRVFIMSITEVEKYFGSAEARQCQSTVYAKTNGCSIYHDNCWWWLRTEGSSNSYSPSEDKFSYASFVQPDGAINLNGTSLSANYLTVRPAMWIDIGA